MRHLTSQTAGDVFLHLIFYGIGALSSFRDLQFADMLAGGAGGRKLRRHDFFVFVTLVL